MNDQSSRPDAFDIPALNGWAISHASGNRFSDAPGDAFPATMRLSETGYRLVFSPLFDIVIDIAEKTICVAEITQGAHKSDLHHILYDHVAPRLISLQSPVLHGAGVVIDGRLVILIGDTGAGKSTLCASLQKAGHTLLGDDAIVITQSDGLPTGSAVYPSLRLHPESIDAIYDVPVESRPMAHYSAKRRVEFSRNAPDAERSAPIAGIFHLGGEAGAIEPKATQLPPATACLTCIGQSFAMDPADADAAQARLAQFAKLTSRVPVYSLAYRRDFAILPQVHSLVRDILD